MKATKSYLYWALPGYFLFPYFVFLYFFKTPTEFNFSEILWALKNSLFQSAGAAVVSVLLAVGFNYGLMQISQKYRKIFSMLLLLPQVFPSLYTLLILFSLLHPFPMGSVGIIIAFVTINAGFATVLLNQAVNEKIGNLALVSEVFSLGRLTFLKRIYTPLLKSDLLNIFFLIFVSCLSSFSIPLIVGGGKGTNLEVLIYEKIFVEQNWAAAFSICVFQLLFVFLLGVTLVRPFEARASQLAEGNYLKSKTGLILLLVYLVLYLGGYLSGLLHSFGSLEFLRPFVNDFFQAALHSLLAVSLYLILSAALLLLWLMDYLKTGSFNPIRHLISASTVVVGFSFYLLFPSTPEFDFVKLLLAMTVLLFPALFKMFLQKPVEGLERQILVARQLGISNLNILVHVILRQLQRPLFLWISVMVFWFMSDYAISRSVGLQQPTLGLMTESFLSSFRLQASYLFSGAIILLSLLFLGILYGLLRVLNVVYQKFAL